MTIFIKQELFLFIFTENNTCIKEKDVLI